MNTPIPEDLREQYQRAQNLICGEGWAPFHHLGAIIAELIERIAALTPERDQLREQLDQITQWCDAYPLDQFSEPDLEECRKLLGDTLLTRLSAHNFRHVLNGVAEIARRKP